MLKSPFKIKEINMSSTWVYNIPKNNDCTICRCNLNTPSLYNQEKGIDSYVVSGHCLHSFHQECIKPWVDKNNHCPICSCVWQYSKTNQTKILNPEDDCSDLPSLISMNSECEKEDKEFNKLEKKIIIHKKITPGLKNTIDELKQKVKDDIINSKLSTLLTDKKDGFKQSMIDGFVKAAIDLNPYEPIENNIFSDKIDAPIQKFMPILTDNEIVKQKIMKIIKKEDKSKKDYKKYEDKDDK